MTDTLDDALALLRWDGVRLTSVDDQIIERARKPVLSPSTAHTVLQCPAQHLAKTVLPRIDDPVGPATLGNAGHSVLEELFKLDPGERTLDAARSLAADLDARTELTTEHRSIWREAVERAITGVFDTEHPGWDAPGITHPAQVEVIDVERHFETTLSNGVKMHGYMDRVDRVDGALRLVDYKLGKFKAPNPRYDDNYGDQQRAYTIALEREFDEPVAESVLIYAAERRLRVIDLSPAARTKTESRYLRARNLLDACADSGVYATNPSPLCGWCPLANMCPVAGPRIQQGKFKVAAQQQPTGTIEPLTPPISKAQTPAEEQTMTIETATERRPEAPPYEELVLGDTLNLNSYAAIAANSIESFAFKYVVSRREHEALAERTLGKALEFAQALSTLTLRITSRYAGTESWQSGVHARVRGHVYAALELQEPPFGQGGDAMGRYFAGIESIVLQLLAHADSLYQDNTTDYPPLPLLSGTD